MKLVKIIAIVVILFLLSYFAITFDMSKQKEKKQVKPAKISRVYKEERARVHKELPHTRKRVLPRAEA